MEIHRAKPEEAAMLTGIAFAAKRHWGYPQEWIQSWKDVLTIRPEFIAKHEAYTACVEREIVGFYALACELRRMSLEHLWVVPRAMGEGVGRALFNHAVQRAKAMGAQRIEIESDPNAQAFYERMGARQVSTKVSDFEPGRRVLPVLIYEIRDRVTF